MSKIVNLSVASERKQKPSAELVDLLKRLLARAESGELRGVAVAAISENATGTEWGCEGNSDMLSAAVADLAFRIARQRYEGSCICEDK